MTYLALVSSVESQLRELYALRHEQEGLTQSDLADRLGIDKSSVHRRLLGASNLTLKTLADMVWGLKGSVDVDIQPLEIQCPSNDAFKNEMFKTIRHTNAISPERIKVMTFEDQI